MKNASCSTCGFNVPIDDHSLHQLRAFLYVHLPREKVPMIAVWLWTTIGLAETSPDTDGMINIPRSGDIPSFWIDRYEFPNQQGITPTAALTFATAQQNCASVGKRLCTAAEWRRACAGLSNSPFSYGDTPRSGVCHQSPAQTTSHTSLMTGQFVPSGSFPNCKSDEGVFDMIGNVEEWVLDDWRGQPGMLEGGASYTYDVYANCSGRYSRMPDYRLTTDQQIFSAGARCCWSETPLTKDLISLDRTERVTRYAVTEAYDSTREKQLPSGGWMDQYEYPNRPGKHPLTGVTWRQATQLCSQAGKRLCGVYEWEQACAGKEGYAFSMGQHYIKGGCALERMVASASGTHPACENSYGLADMTGNVWEWTSAQFPAPALSTGLPSEMQALAEIRGGSWMVEPSKGACRPSDGYPVTSQNMPFEDVGFRCCRGPEWIPASVKWGSVVQCPKDMIPIGNFCIDQFEHPNKRGHLPSQQLDWTTAQSNCLNAGKRICTETEWTLACEGPDWKGYPYGATYRSGQCATADSSTGSGTALSGAHPNCVTPDGTYDMTGNVWEWVQQANGSGVLRGGGDTLSAGLGRCRSRAVLAGGSRPDAGVRCCFTPPASAP